ncbi:caspase recruitment domain family [Striga asiatica]|uniref:Caspase recruitment domain family n=1 Tax=Striga asiatica TaxID=4170 RepID=A0A5A7R430_STRAF|nr:caspase recruitment domain family [Striga asiatica]
MPPDISLPRAMTAEVGEKHVSPWMLRCSVGIPIFMPYSSHPLFTATQSSPDMMYALRMRISEHESVVGESMRVRLVITTLVEYMISIKYGLVMSVKLLVRLNDPVNQFPGGTMSNAPPIDPYVLKSAMAFSNAAVFNVFPSPFAP